MQRNDEQSVTPVIGVTGNIGAGKSVFCEALVEQGAIVLDADQIGRLILNTNRKVQRQVRDLLGDNIVLESGEFDRQKIAVKVFTDIELLTRFNAIMHPCLVQAIKKNVTALQKEAAYPAIVIDAAVIFEADVHYVCNTIIVIAADDDRRLQRVHHSGKFTANDIQNRMNAQIPQSQKIDRADIVVWNNGTQKELKEKAYQIYQDIIHHV